MKKTSLVLLAVVFLVAVPGKSMAVELLPSCAYVYDPPAGFDPATIGLLGLLASLGLEGVPANAWEADLETIGGEMAGDGIPDMYQLGMLGAVLCAGDPTILAKFGTRGGEGEGEGEGERSGNVGAFVTLFEGLANMLTGALASAETAAALGAMPGSPDCGRMALWANTYLSTESTPSLADAEAFEAALIAYHDQVNGFAGTYGMLLPVLDPLLPWFAAMGGLDTLMSVTLESLLGELTNTLVDTAAPMHDAAALCLVFAAAVANEGGDVPEGECPEVTAAQLAADLSALGTQVEGIADYLDSVGVPVLQLLDRGSPVGEDFAADGDYNGDGITNKHVYDQLLRLSGSPINNDVQTLTVTNGDGGDTFTVSFGGQTTGAQPWNVPAATLKTALEGLSTIGTGNVAVTLVGTVYTVTFKNARGGTDVDEMTTVGTGCTVPVATITEGGNNEEEQIALRAEYIYWATGVLPFPDVPVTGGIGLALLAGVCALGGARVLRKK